MVTCTTSFFYDFSCCSTVSFVSLLYCAVTGAIPRYVLMASWHHLPETVCPTTACLSRDTLPKGNDIAKPDERSAVNGIYILAYPTSYWQSQDGQE